MHDHDLDLIAALADGTLDDESEALALVESCPECRAEYEGQLGVIRLLESTPAAEMTDVERAALHRDLWTQLREGPVEPSASRWWYRLAYVAAGLLVVIGLASALNGPWFGAGDSGGAESYETADQARDEEGGQVPLAGVAEDGAEGATTTAAAAAETIPYPFAELADEARAKLQGDTEAATVTTAGDEARECLTRLGLEGQQVVDRLDLDQIYLILISDEKGETVTFVALGDCRIAYVDG